MNKKIILFLSLFLFAFILSYGQGYSLGGGLEYNTTTENFGLNLRGYYNIGEHFCFGPELSYAFIGDEVIGNIEEDTSVFEINLNAHYIFEVFDERIGLYPLFGFNYTIEDISLTDLQTGNIESETEEIWGTNIGAGFHVPIKNFAPFLEYHYITGQLGEHVVAVGLLYTFNKNKHESKHKK